MSVVDDLRRLVLSWLPLVAVVVAALLVRAFVIEPYVVPSPSMESTLLVGDVFLGEKWDVAARPPEPGEVVTFLDPRGSGQTLVKRVVAVAGQVVDVRDGTLWVDGERLAEPYARGRTLELEGSAQAFPQTVPEGCVWVMGDNREDSLDSRAYGPVRVGSVTSRAWVRVVPWSRRGRIG